ncbi:MAG: glycosyltransferase family 4 protein [Chthoniobacterales bacterium]|nr:glycosyltransferase family 4 protein [Chthoniobacterales bacterium]
MKPHVHFFGGQGIGWALDEDLERARAAVAGEVVAGSFAASPIIHSAWWPPLLQAGAVALRGKSILCFADNPPAFYLTRPGFEEAAARVDLWIARSREAVAQFEELGLPVVRAPYTVDPGIFCPLPAGERAGIRQKLGLSDGDFVVGNFHRDSLEKNLARSKAQKGPDVFVEIVERARREIPSLKVLLAGPRRHWLRGELARRNLPFVFAGKTLSTDDFSVNVLSRRELNRLYSALDCVLISSRWEGGPYSVLESLFAGRPVISTPVGMAADLLDGWLYTSPQEGADLLVAMASGRVDFSPLRAKALTSHSAATLGECLVAAYKKFSGTREPAARQAGALWNLGLRRIFRGVREPLGCHPHVADIMNHVRRKQAEPGSLAARAIEIANAETEAQIP